MNTAMRSEKERHAEEVKLLAAIAAAMPELDDLLKRCSDHWGYEDPTYRFYHQSMKVFYLQETTGKIVERLQAFAPHIPLNRWFMEMVEAGTGKEFTFESNDNWTAETRPIVEAFFHARYMLEMICKYGKTLTEPPTSIPSGWAAALYLYDLR